MASDEKPIILHPPNDWVDFLGREEPGEWEDLSEEEQEELEAMFEEDDE